MLAGQRDRARAFHGTGAAGRDKPAAPAVEDLDAGDHGARRDRLSRSARGSKAVMPLKPPKYRVPSGARRAEPSK
jgi:hypothetical protein